jgi:hypothetical protein
MPKPIPGGACSKKSWKAILVACHLETPAKVASFIEPERSTTANKSTGNGCAATSTPTHAEASAAVVLKSSESSSSLVAATGVIAAGAGWLGA